MVLIRDIYVDSRRRTEPSGNSYTMYIQNTLKNVEKVDLVTATIPNTVYNITDGTDVMSVGSTQITINPGFYSACNIVSTLIGAFPPELGISGKFIEAEGKIVFYSTSSFTIVINSQELSSISGFTQGITYNAVLNDTTYYVKSNTVVNMKSLGDYIFLDILELRRPYESDAVSDVYNSESFINFATIPMDVNSGSIKTFKEMSDYRISVTYPKFIDQIDRLTINWLDTNGNSINFNGVDDNSFILRFYMKDDERIKAPDFSEKALLPKKMITSDVRNYFIFALLSILFILFIKNK
jgi:hypothetical protein